MPATHPLADNDVVDFTDLLDEPFLALPPSAGHGRPPVLGAEISGPDETYEALVDGRGVCLLAKGNAALLTCGDVVTRPVRGVSPSRLALAWRAEDIRPLVPTYAQACRRTLSE